MSEEGNRRTSPRFNEKRSAGPRRSPRSFALRCHRPASRDKPGNGAGAGGRGGPTTFERLCVAEVLVLLVIVVAGSRTSAQEEPPDPAALCRRSPERPECVLFL